MTQDSARLREALYRIRDHRPFPGDEKGYRFARDVARAALAAEPRQEPVTPEPDGEMVALYGVAYGDLYDPCLKPKGHDGPHDPSEPTPFEREEPCCSEENPHRAIPTITDRTRIARHWFDEAAVFPATKMYAASDIETEPPDNRRVRAGWGMHAVGDRDPGVAVPSATRGEQIERIAAEVEKAMLDGYAAELPTDMIAERLYDAGLRALDSGGP